MGIQPFNLSSSINLIIAQRLVRKLCEKCKTSESSKRCDACNDGFRGRTGIFEILRVNEDVAQIICEEHNSIALDQAAKKSGMQTLRELAQLKVKQGITTIEEINRVIN